MEKNWGGKKEEKKEKVLRSWNTITLFARLSRRLLFFKINSSFRIYILYIKTCKYKINSIELS